MDKKAIRFAYTAAIGMLAAGFLWQLLEKLFYGDIQPRFVDDLIYLLWAGTVFYAYYRGRIDQREEKIKNQAPAENKDIIA